MGAAPAFRGAQASIGAGPVVSGGNFAGRGSPQFAQGGYQGGYRGGFRGDRDHDRHFGRGAFIGGLAVGGALGYDYGYPYYYGDDYAYDDGYYDTGPGYAVSSPGYEVSGVADPAYCAQRYRSYDPASGTYLGYDGLRHPCGE